MKAKDHFASEEEFEEFLELADAGARSVAEVDFVTEMIERQEQYGLDVFISTSQLEWLQRLANK